MPGPPKSSDLYFSISALPRVLLCASATWLGGDGDHEPLVVAVTHPTHGGGYQHRVRFRNTSYESGLCYLKLVTLVNAFISASSLLHL